MKKILLATTNESKRKYYSEILKQLNVEVLSLKDLEIKASVEETGSIPKENSIIKAKEYFKKSGIVTMAEDVGLFIDKLPEEKQPGVYIRRVNGKALTDEEALEHYVNLIKSVGGESKGRYLKSLAIALSEDNVVTHEFVHHQIFTTNVQEKRNMGYPLDSITITPEFDKYTVELTEEENQKLTVEKDRELIEFIKNTLNLN